MSDPTPTLSESTTRLFSAAESGDAARVRELLAQGADAGARNARMQETALILAASSGSVECVEALFPFSDPEARDFVGYRALEQALRDGREECARWLMDKTDLASASPDGCTALHHALNANQPILIEALIDRCDLLARDKAGLDAFLVAAYRGQDKPLQAIGARLKELPRDLQGSDALMLAARGEAHTGAPGAAVDWLMRTCDPLAANAQGNTALMEAARCGQTEFVKKLIGVSRVDQRNRRGQTALSFALIHQKWDCVDVLAEAWPDETHLGALNSYPQAKNLPRLNARREAKAIRQAMGFGDAQKSNPTPSRAERAADESAKPSPRKNRL